MRLKNLSLWQRRLNSFYLDLFYYSTYSCHFKRPSVDLSIYMTSDCPSTDLSIYLTSEQPALLHPSIHLSIYASIHLNTSLCSRPGRISHGSAVSMLNIHKSSNTPESVGSKSSILTSSSILTNGSIQHNSLNSRLNNSNQHINSIKPVYWSNYKVLIIWNTIFFF